MELDSLFTGLIGASLIFALIIFPIVAAIYVVYVIALWKLFKKAGKNGWEALIPFYNTYVLIEISGLNWWYFLIAISGSILSILNIKGLSTICNLASLAINFFVFYNIAKKMKQQPVGYAVASIFVEPIIVMVLGFSNKYTFDKNIPVSPNGPIGENTNTSKSEKFCLGCGCKLKENDAFCQNCGKKVE